jgi:hydrogenase 3 maturation protease
MMRLQDRIKENNPASLRLAILGVGSELRSDDAAGMYFISLLGKLADRPDILLMAGSTAPENFTGQIRKFSPDKLFIVDAADLGLSPGEVALIPTEDITGTSFMTHRLPLPILIKYLQSEVGCAIIVIGIQPQSTDYGCSLSKAVRDGTKRLARDFISLFARVALHLI